MQASANQVHQNVGAQTQAIDRFGQTVDAGVREIANNICVRGAPAP